MPYTPVPNQDPNKVVIYYINDKGNLEIVKNCKYNPKTGMLTFTTNHFSQYTALYNDIRFDNVSDSDWFASAVDFIAAREITAGIGNNNFGPQNPVTRGQFITILMRAYDIPEALGDNFEDAGNTYYTGYLAAAKQLGISCGIGGNLFAPERVITREEMFTMLYSTLKTLGKLPKGIGKPITEFSDEREIADWAREALAYLVENGTIAGSGDKLNPKATSTRAEMAQIFYGIMSK